MRRTIPVLVTLFAFLLMAIPVAASAYQLKFSGLEADASFSMYRDGLISSSWVMVGESVEWADGDRTAATRLVVGRYVEDRDESGNFVIHSLYGEATGDAVSFGASNT
jgi:hypothetical protein